LRAGLYAGPCTSHRYPVQGDIDLGQPNTPDGDETTAKTPTAFLALENMSSLQSDGDPGVSGRKVTHNNNNPPSFRMDLAEEIRGMYHLLELISESGSNGCGNIKILMR